MNKTIVGMVSISIVLGALFVMMDNDKKENEVFKESEYVSCFELCSKKIPGICPDINDKILGYKTKCEVNCNTWSDSLKSCIAKAKECDQLDLDFSRNAEDINRIMRKNIVYEIDKIKNSSNCTIIDDDYSEIEKKDDNKEIEYGCSGACYKYKQCVGFGEDVGEKEKNEAYDTCFKECQGWSKETLNCMKKVKINNPSDCMPLSMCGLSEYKKQGYL